MNLKYEIIKNPFAERLRNEVKIDREAFESLCALLVQLAKEWNGEKSVDKQLVQQLYALPTIIRGVADSLRNHRSDMAEELDEMWIKVDGLILECFANTPN